MAKERSASRLALITGAAGGIGAAICERLAADGFRIAGLDIDAVRLSDLEKRLGGAFAPYAADQTDEAATRRAIADVERSLGPIDTFVNVTGWSGATRFETETSDYWRKVIAINYESLLFATHAVLPGMIARQTGRMVFIASESARVGTPSAAVYAGAKGAVIAFAKSLARENARHGITVNCVSPGATETALHLQTQKDQPEVIERILRAIPLRRAALPSEQAAAVAFLVSPDAGYITGQTLSVGGGTTMI
ncbi:MAG TPA: SDR family NAD(P)-dependent oxidoreductase [Dongiaceae bacterium]|nr:SDR family NAD(P)-dependent oxidoreductase [Dongiaceae bacterium]